jgi:L-aminopeptidase/D-esterase-like protein
MTAGDRNALTDVPGIRVGNATKIGGGALTGTTVVLMPPGSVCAVDVRGGAPATRDTAALDPRYGVRHPDAIVLSGGSSYGLSAAHGVFDQLARLSTEEPLVPAAALFDLGRGGEFHAHPGAETGVAALLDAQSSGEHAAVEQGNVGAGTGAVTAEMKGGVGTASMMLSGGIVVAALVAMNARGAAINPADGLPYAHAAGVSSRMRGGEVVDWQEFPLNPSDGEELSAARELLAETVRTRPSRKPLNTVIGVIATNAVLTHAQACQLAAAAQDGLAVAIHPSHCLGDGDTIFALATGASKGAGADAVIGTATEVTARALVHAVLAAESVTTPWGHIASYREVYPGAHPNPAGFSPSET